MVKGGEGGGIGAEGRGMGYEGGPISVDKDKALGAGAGSRLLALLLLTSGLWESHFIPLCPGSSTKMEKQALPQRVSRSYSK